MLDVAVIGVGSFVALVAVVGLSRNRWTAFIHALAAASGTALVILIARDHHEIAHIRSIAERASFPSSRAPLVRGERA